MQLVSKSQLVFYVKYLVLPSALSLPPFLVLFAALLSISFSSPCPEAMDRKAGCVTVQPTLPETAVSALDFVRAERDQLLVSAAFFLPYSLSIILN